VQSVTRVPLSLYLGPRLVNVVSLAYKILTANHVLIMQPRGRTTGMSVVCSSAAPERKGLVVGGLAACRESGGAVIREQAH
jgi:hypothetical protein